jgi:hypothetical protein
MLADAQDGTLSAADQALFDSHMATCGPCGQLLADAKRGVAWLEMLRDPQPEPPAMLVEKILAQTSGLAPAGAVGVAGAAVVPHRGVVLPLRQRAWAALRRSPIGQIALQPRLAMTAAMAFFSVALTMDITGTRLQDLKPSNLRPSNLKQGFYSANARVVRYYEGLRVVYELESRVRDMETVRGDDAQGSGTQSAPAPKQQPAPPSAQPGGQPNQNAPEKKGGSSRGAPSGAIWNERQGSRMSLARYVPRRPEIADLNGWMLEMGTGTVREGRLV